MQRGNPVWHKTKQHMTDYGALFRPTRPSERVKVAPEIQNREYFAEGN